MRWSRPGRLLWAALGLALGCEAGGIVGGECRVGYLACGGDCVDPMTDPDHCGGCNRSCADGQLCVQAECSGSIGVSGGPGAGVGGSGASGANTAGSGGTGWNYDGGDQSDVPIIIGSGGTSGSGTGSGGQVGGTGALAGAGGLNGGGGTGGGLACEAPTQACAGECVDVSSDPENCGACGRVCPSGLCQDGACVGATSGHVVLMCMDYEQGFSTSAQSMLLGNAVFLSFRSSVRVLGYSEFADATAKTRVDNTIQRAATARGRDVVFTHVVDSNAVLSAIEQRELDVLMVYDQPTAPAGHLATIGAEWASELTAFLTAGGTAVVLNGGTGTGEMAELIEQAQLLPVTGQVDATYTTLYNRAPFDAVGLNVISPFFALPQSCTFATTAIPDDQTVFVVTNTEPSEVRGQPAVVHRIWAR